MKSLLLLLYRSTFVILAGSLFTPIQAQEPLPGMQAHIDSLFTPWHSTKTPGAIVAVIRNGQVLYQRAYGMADIAHKEALTPTHSFWVASMAKQFTAMSIALLAEQGKLTLHDDIRKYLPELPYLGDTVRIEHLIHHTSGLRDGFTLIGLTFKGEKHYTNQNVLAAMAQQKNLNFKPGQRYEYLNGGYVLLAEIVARVSGLSFPEFTEQAIFRPLGMNQTKFYGNFNKLIPGLAKGYGVNYKNGQVRYRPNQFKGNTVGSSGLVTTLADLIKWNENFYQNKLGKGNQALINQILTTSKLNDGSLSKYAYGLEVTYYKGYIATSHSGSDPGYTAEMVRFPEQKVTVICLANTDNLYSLTSKLLHLGEEIIQNKVIKEQPVAFVSSNTDLEKLTGYYLNSANNQDLKVITLADHKLYAASSLNGYKAPLVPAAPLTFQNQGLKEYEIRFRNSENGQETLLQYAPLREDSYSLQKLTPIKLSKTQLKAYAGRYYSPELNKTYHLGLRKGKLGLKLFHILFIPFQPLEGNRFLADLQGNNCLQFSTDASGAPTGFTFNRAAITNLSFVRKK